MGTNQLDTNLNQYPYWADFQANSYYNYLFKPSTPVQVKELNGLQLLSQEQIASFANNIFNQGTIISGCNINLDSNLKYVKLADTYANGSAATIDNFTGLTAVSNTSGLTASIFSVSPGFITQAPALNTLYIKYLNTGYVANTSNLSQNVAVSTFQQNEVINIVNPANVIVASIQVANDTVSGNSGTVGNSYSLAVDAGQIFQKGYALVVNKQNIIVSPYNNQPDGVSVGFVSQETIITSYQDSSLLDNSQGSPNSKGSGADRLQIVPILEVIETGTGNNDFFALADFVSGQAAIINQDTSFNVIGNKIAQVSSETNGNFVIKPFNLSSQESVFSNGVIDANNFRLNISSGLGYISGQRVNLLSQIFTTVRKGTDVNYTASQIMTAQMGNFINVKEIYGALDTTTPLQIQLLASNTYAVSHYAANGVAVSAISPGSSIGTAAIGGFQYINPPGSPATTGLLYLINIQMNAGYSFNNVQSIFANNAGRLFFCDVTAYQGQLGVNQPQYAPLIYDLGQQAVQSLKTASNTRDTQFVYNVGAGVTFTNTTGQASVTIPSATGGINELPFGTGNVAAGPLLAGDFVVIAQGNSAMANIAGSASVATANLTVTGTSTTFLTSLWPGAQITLANSSASEIKMVATIANNTSLTLQAPSVATWTAANIHVTILNGDSIPLASLPNASINITNSTSFTASLGNTLTTSLPANIFYQVARTQAAPAVKHLLTSVWVSINCANHSANSVGPWTLGIPDGYKVNNVYVGTTFSNANPDLSSQFNLVNNQRDAYYGLSSLAVNGAVLSSTSRILINLQAFIPDWSSGSGYFSVESYPIDDTGVTANSILTQDVPFYFSIAAQATYNLRNCLDFRLYRANTIPYLTNGSAAATNTAIINPPISNGTFNSSAFTSLSVDSNIETSYSYYMGRYDQVGLTATANIVVNEGLPSASPVPGGQIINGMNIGTIFIPPYPSLTQDVIDLQVPYIYPRISFVYTTNKRYTMQDIGAIDQRLSQVEYYTALSALEQSVTNLLTQNQNGQSIFQNGIFADPFQNFALANCSDPAFNIAIDSNQDVGRPTFSQYPVNLIYSAGTNTSIDSGGRLISLTPNTTSVLISQPFASQVRNCAQDVTYNYAGTVYLTPDGDYQPDVTVNPDVVATINDYQNFVSLANAWGTQWGNWNETSTTSTQNGIVAAVNPLNGILDVVTTATSTTTQTSTRTGTQLVATPEYNEYQLGTAITSISVQPYARAAIIKFVAYGLKPSTEHWVYVDDEAMSNNCFQTNLAFTAPLSAIGGPMITDATGAIAGYLYLPADTFNSGTLNFQIMDISNNVTELNVISSVATATYYATNLAYTENNLELQTVTGQLSQVQVSQSTSSTSSTGPYITGVLLDPVGQTFTIAPSLISDTSDCVFLETIHLFFQQKDPSLGITIQVRPLTSSGLPDQYCLPYGQVHLTPSQVSISQNATVPTVVSFPDPLLLESGSSYCFICIPDGSNPNYNIWTGVLGANNVTGGKIYSLSSTGVMVMSSQGVTWTPYQTESIKFNLNIARWNSNNSGIARFYNDNSEYLDISNTFGSFRLGDQTISTSNSNLLATANGLVNSTSNSVVISSTSLLASNSKVIVTSPNNQSGYLANVVSVTNSTAFVVNTRPTSNDNIASVYLIVGNGLTGVVGDVNSSFIRIANSSANSSQKFVSSNGYAVLDLNTNAFTFASNLFNLPYNTLMAKFAPTIPGLSNLAITMQGTSNTNTTDSAYTNLAIGVSSDFLDYERTILSRSNEIAISSSFKSLAINVNMTSNSSYQSPTLDTVKLGAYTVHNIVVAEDANNDIYNSEIQNLGNGYNRYISSTINLAAGMDAENLTVYVGAHWPAGTEVYVYAKILNQYDPGTWQSKVWSPMIPTNSYRASPINLNDFADYQFNFANTVTTNGTAYLDPANSNVLTYVSNSVNYATFVSFAVKIVLLSNNSPTVPLVTDLRAVCTTSSS